MNIWFIKREKSRKYTSLSAVIFREAHRYSPNFLRFPSPGYSHIAVHSGRCSDLLNSSNLENDRLQQSPVTGRSSHLWAFVPDQKRCNLCSGRVLDVVDSSLKNYAPVHQCPFNGADSQRWQLLSC